MNYDRLPESVSIFEVGPRDGFQDEPEFIATEKKIQFINMLTEAGCKKIEIGSFVHPKWNYSLTRVTYSPFRVSMVILSPSWINGGTRRL